MPRATLINYKYLIKLIDFGGQTMTLASHIGDKLEQRSVGVTEIDAVPQAPGAEACLGPAIDGDAVTFQVIDSA